MTESSHLDPQPLGRNRQWKWPEPWETSQPTARSTHKLQKGYVSQFFATSFTNEGPSIEIYEPMKAILIQSTITVIKV